jgi:hypothetical protein
MAYKIIVSPRTQKEIENAIDWMPTVLKQKFNSFYILNNLAYG